MPKTNNTIIATKHLNYLLFSGILTFLLMGILISPERLIQINIMKTSLTSHIPSVKELALLEVYGFRILCFTLTIVLTTILIFRNRIVNFLIDKKIILSNVPKEEQAKILNPSFAIIFGTLALALIYILTGTDIFPKETLKLINDEDGFIEYMSAIFFLISGIVSLILGVKIKNHLMKKAIFVAFGLLFIFTAGEEVSWGQRLFDMETMAVFEDINVQNENNIHNAYGYLFDHVFIAFVFAFGFGLPFLANTNVIVRDGADYLGIPVASMGLAIGFLAISLIHDYTVYKFIDHMKYLRMAELREFLTSLGFLLLFIESWGREKFHAQNIGVVLQ